MMALWNGKNTYKASVHDVEGVGKMKDVLSVDDETGFVEYASQPIRACGESICTEIAVFESIYPVYGGEFWPVMFLCFGRK